MKKRSKKRVPQDIKPWARINNSEEGFLIFAKAATRWVAGSRKDWNTKMLTAASTNEPSSMILRAIINEMGDPINAVLQQKINKKLHQYIRMKSQCRYKNYCAFTGRGRTFNRILYMARHSVRKLAGIGVISGLVK